VAPPHAPNELFGSHPSLVEPRPRAPPPGARHRYVSVTKESRRCNGRCFLPAGAAFAAGHVPVPVTAGIASRMCDGLLAGGVSSGRVLWAPQRRTRSVEGDCDLWLRQLPRPDEKLDFGARLPLVDGSGIPDGTRVVAERRSKTACIPQAVDQLGQQRPNADGDAHCAQHVTGVAPRHYPEGQIDPY